MCTLRVSYYSIVHLRFYLGVRHSRHSDASCRQKLIYVIICLIDIIIIIINTTIIIIITVIVIIIVSRQIFYVDPLYVIDFGDGIRPALLIN